MNTYKEKNQAENLKANARTQRAINSGKNETEIQLSETVNTLVNQVALYRAASLSQAKKIVNQLLKEVTK